MQRTTHSSFTRGFTLIELLVVIAIIGLLAAVVLASVGSARSKGVDAAVKSSLDSVRSQAEIYASNSASNNYSGVCTDSKISTILTNAYGETTKGGSPNVVTSASTAGTWSQVTCHENGSAWAVEAPLSASASGAPVMWCVDSNGSSKQESTNLTTSGATQYACL